MIKKFKNFDADEFISKKRALKESAEVALDPENKTMVAPKIDPNVNKEDVITGTPVYEDKYLFKIAKIIWKRLKNIGEFNIYHDIIYLNNVPGIWFYGIGNNSKHIVCCRDTNSKSLSVFDEFELGTTNKATVTYSTEKLGFKDMLDQMELDLKESNPAINEELILEAGGFGNGYGPANLKNFKNMPWVDKELVYDVCSTKTKGDAILYFKAGVPDRTTHKVMDRNISRILAAFSPKGEANEGSAKYIVALGFDIIADRYSSVDATFKSIADEYKAKYKGGSPVISTSYGVEFDVDDEEEQQRQQEEQKRRDEEFKAAEEERIRIDREKYVETMRSLREMTEVMCNYVKQNGILNADDKSALPRRGIILIGKGGIGKTNSVKKALKAKNMIKNKDYIWVGSESVTADKLYSLMYKYNGKLIIFDDTGDLFEGKYNGPLWKAALQTDLEDCEIGYPRKESKLNVYDDRVLSDRQKRYFAEIGAKSDEEKTAFYKNKMKKLDLYFSKNAVHGVASHDPEVTPDEIKNLMDQIEAEWKEEAQRIEPAMPSHFYYTGVVIIMTNLDKEEFIDSVGGNSSWKALSSRFRNFIVNPYSETLWSVIKAQILDEYNNNSLDDAMCMIPRNMTEEFIEEVESLLAEDPCEGLTYRTIVGFSSILRGAPGLRTWKTTLRSELIGE